MRIEEVKVGKSYWVKVSGKAVPVKIMQRMGVTFVGFNTSTKRTLPLSASRCLREVA